MPLKRPDVGVRLVEVPEEETPVVAFERVADRTTRQPEEGEPLGIGKAAGAGPNPLDDNVGDRPDERSRRAAKTRCGGACRKPAGEFPRIDHQDRLLPKPQLQ